MQIQYAIGKTLRHFNHYGTETAIFQEDKVSAMVADALALYVAMPAVSMISIM